jgi:hypothetical protein
VREFAQWRAVPADERSAAPAWWWQLAFEVLAQQEERPPLAAYAWNFRCRRPMQTAPLC